MGQALFQAINGAERYRVENVDTGAIRYDDNKEAAWRSVQYFVYDCHATKVRLEDTEKGTITEYNVQ